MKDISERALGVWNGAVEHAEQHQASIRTRIAESAAEMRTIAEQLGELSAIEDPNSSMVRQAAACRRDLLLDDLVCAGPRRRKSAGSIATSVAQRSCLVRSSLARRARHFGAALAGLAVHQPREEPQAPV